MMGETEEPPGLADRCANTGWRNCYCGLFLCLCYLGGGSRCTGCPDCQPSTVPRGPRATNATREG